MELVIIVVLLVFGILIISLQEKKRVIDYLKNLTEKQQGAIRSLEERNRGGLETIGTMQEDHLELFAKCEAHGFALTSLVSYLQESPSAHTTVLHSLGEGTVIAIAVAPGQTPPQTILVFGSENPIYDSWALIDIIVDMDDAEDDGVLGRTIRIKAPGQFALIWASSPNITVIKIPPMD